MKDSTITRAVEAALDGKTVVTVLRHAAVRPMLDRLDQTLAASLEPDQRRVHYLNGGEGIDLANGGRILLRSTRGAGQGLMADLVVIATPIARMEAEVMVMSSPCGEVIEDFD